MNPTDDPKEWSRRLDTINQSYRGWAASMIWWRYVEPSGTISDERRKALSNKWSHFKRTEVPAFIPLSLDREVLDKQLDKIGYAPTAQMAASRAYQFAKRANQRAASIRNRDQYEEQTP